jgi:phage gp36-like protein
VTYITLEDLSKKLGEYNLVQLTDNSNSGEIDEDVVNDAIKYAQGVFDGYVRLRYELPVPTTPLVRSLNISIAIFNLIENRASLDEGTYKIRENAYKNAIGILKNIGEGKAALDVPAVEETVENPKSSDVILTNAAKSKFSDDRLKSF